MSVNEVRLKKAGVEPFVVRGSGPPTSRTFCIGNEDHTIGNALRHVMIQNQNVTFAGYSVPHPSEPIVQIRVQTTSNTTAIDTLKQSCQTLHDQCDIMLEQLEDLLPEVRDDRIRIENLLLYDDDEEQQEGVDDDEQQQDFEGQEYNQE